VPFSALCIVDGRNKRYTECNICRYSIQYKLLYKAVNGPSGRAVWSVGLRPLLVVFAGSNPTTCMVVCLLWVLCVVRHRSLRRADHSSRGVLPTLVCSISAVAKPCKVWPWHGIWSYYLPLTIDNGMFYCHSLGTDLPIPKHVAVLDCISCDWCIS